VILRLLVSRLNLHSRSSRIRGSTTTRSPSIWRRRTLELKTPACGIGAIPGAGDNNDSAGWVYALFASRGHPPIPTLQPVSSSDSRTILNLTAPIHPSIHHRNPTHHDGIGPLSRTVRNHSSPWTLIIPNRSPRPARPPRRQPPPPHHRPSPSPRSSSSTPCLSYSHTRDTCIPSRRHLGP
jgi:hypothetical protein